MKPSELKEAHVRAIYRDWLECPLTGWGLARAERCVHCDQHRECKAYEKYLDTSLERC